MTVTCITRDCSERGVVKPQRIPLAPGEFVVCGVCGQPCELGEDPADG